LDIEIARIGLIIAMLSIVSYFDIFKNKNIPDMIYRVFAVIGIVLLLYNNPWGWIPVISSIGLSVIVGMGLFIIGAWGGADAKVMFAVALLQPIWTSPFPYEKMALHPFTAIIMMSNAAMIAGLVYLPVVVLRKSAKIKIAFLPFLSLGYLFTVLKGDMLLWIKKYIFSVF
tara:strand:+ start:294 stop:806 length:513 start_codon:yes stop_codon:yes gene_type:complete